MRLVILTQYYLPEMGAPQGRLSRLARAAAARGHEVTVLTALPNYPRGRIFEGYGYWPRRERIEGIDVLRAPLWPSKSPRIAPRLVSYASFALSSLALGLLRLRSFDVLLAESPPLFLMPTAWLLARLRRARWVMNVSDLWPASAVALGAVRRDWRLRLVERLEAWCYRRAWLLTGQSPGIVQALAAAAPRQPPLLLSNGADLELFEVPGEAPPRTERLVVYAGLIGLAQGLDQLIDAARHLRALPELRVLLVGDGPARRHLEERARSEGLHNVEFRDPLPRDRIPALLASASVVFVGLGVEIPGAFPSKLYEAMAAGRPLVLAAGGEPADLVRRLDCGRVVPPGDGPAIAGAIADLLDHPDEARRLGRRARAAAEEHFDHRRIVERFLDALEDRLHREANSQ